MFTNGTRSLEEMLRENPRELVIELSYNQISPNQPLMRVCKPGKTPSSKPVNILGGLLIGDSHSQLLRLLADALDLAHTPEAQEKSSS